MKPYRLRLTLTGPLGTALTGDTLLGHVCWGMVYHQGASVLADFLEQMRSPAPPLVCGDPVPAGFLPAPALPPASTAEHQRMLDRLPGEDDLARHDWLKAFRNRRWVPAAALAACIEDLSAESLLGAALRAGRDGGEPPGLTEALIAHNTINRLTQHTADDGGLYFQGEHFPKSPVDYDLYLLSSLAAERIVELFQWGLAGGYGRDASTGKGRLLIGELDDTPWPAAKAPNAALALGVFAPAAADPARGWWRTAIRLGKLGGPWALDEGGEHPPFKHPLCLLQAGAVLAPCRLPYVGRVVLGVHPTRPEVVTCAMAPILPLRCPALAPAAEEHPPCPPTT